MPAKTAEALQRKKANAAKKAHDRYHSDPARREWYKDWGFRRYYGITKADYDRMFAEQKGLCACCHERPCKPVDHNHQTKRVRALLCYSCNIGLGFIERPGFVEQALAYLDRYKA